MVKITYDNNRQLYECSKCGFKYADKEWAEKCEQWCREHRSCNMEITKYAVSAGGASSKKERKQQRRLEKERARQKVRFRQKTKKIALIVASVLIIVAGAAAGVWRLGSRSEPSAPQPKIISTNGIHWHSHLSIKIKGETQEIPSGIGLGITERPIHTHEADGVIHLEFPGRVTEDDVRLGKFFEIWGKTFNSNCIFDKCSGPEGQLQMLVNGQPNFDFDNYVMRDGDKIEIIYE